MAFGGRRRSVNRRPHAEHDDLCKLRSTLTLQRSIEMLGLRRGEEAWLLSNRHNPESCRLPSDRSIREFGHALRRVKHFRNLLRFLIA